MDDDSFHKIAILLLVMLLLSNFLILQTAFMAKKQITNLDNSKCNMVLDTIYDQCKQEGGTNISSLTGRNTQISYDNGVCVIK